jgi:septum formation protein
MLHLLLGSKSPRRQEILKGANLPFELVSIDSDENFPPTMKGEEVAEFLAIKKSNAYKNELKQSILLTADTVVFLEGEIINKPNNEKHAIDMLEKLSGKMHTVYTGVCLRSTSSQIAFTDKTNVYFNKLASSEINYYIHHYKPLDKAGAYGIQDWIGYIGIEKIEGNFFNVMGLPINKVYKALSNSFGQDYLSV